MADPAAAANIWDLLVSLSWPAGAIAVVSIFREPLHGLLSAAAEKLRQASSVKFGNIELKGPIVPPNSPTVMIGGNEYARRPASSADNKKREGAYSSTRRLMLAHRIRPSSTAGQKFDISIFLVKKKSETKPGAEFSDVAYVEYYLGPMFGHEPNGSWFVVKTPDDGFAVTTSAFGQALCMAKIHFRDGEVVETSRFLDFQMSGAFPDQGQGT